jgi:NAD(P)H-flavin reductase
MSNITFEDQTIEVGQDDLVLDALIRHGHTIPFGCRGGVCQSCLMIADSGAIPAAAQNGLNDAQKKLNYFMSCQCHPECDMSVRLPGASALQVKGEVIDKTFLTDQVIRLRVKADLQYEPGQYVNLWRDDTLARSYSLASLPHQEDFLEFHIKLAENGQFSGWLAEEVEVGTELGVQGPMGECIFSASADQPILMAGISTGLAPLYGIVRQALSEGVKSPIHLLLAARVGSGFYLTEALQALAAQYDNLHLHFVCQDEAPDYAQQEDVYNYCKAHFAELKNWRVFLCGAESFVKKMRKHCFLSGASMRDISADSFVAAPTN